MKAGTAARLLYLAVTIVVLVVTVVPICQSVMNNDLKAPEIGTQALYELEYMNKDTLEDNLSDAVSGKSGCTVEFGNESLPVDSGNCGTVASTIMASGAETAIVKGSDGKVIIQQVIKYQTEVIAGYRTGIQLSGMAEKVSKMEFRMHMISEDKKVDIVSNSHTSPVTGEIGASCVIPMVVYNIAAGYGCYMGTYMDIEYEKLATITLDMGEKNQISTDSDIKVEKMDGKTVITVTGSPFASTSSGDIGGVSIEFSDSGYKTMTLSCDGDMSEMMESNLIDGCLKITMGGESYVMDRNMTDSFISTIDMLEGSP